MDVGWFESPVAVEIGPGKVRNVLSAREAAECLLYQWPPERGRHYRRAHMACISVIEGDKVPNHARKAFLQAAREARILRVPARDREESLA